MRRWSGSYKSLTSAIHIPLQTRVFLSVSSPLRQGNSSDMEPSVTLAAAADSLWGRLSNSRGSNSRGSHSAYGALRRAVSEVAASHWEHPLPSGTGSGSFEARVMQLVARWEAEMVPAKATHHDGSTKAPLRRSTSTLFDVVRLIRSFVTVFTNGHRDGPTDVWAERQIEAAGIVFAAAAILLLRYHSHHRHRDGPFVRGGPLCSTILGVRMLSRAVQEAIEANSSDPRGVIVRRYLCDPEYVSMVCTQGATGWLASSTQAAAIVAAIQLGTVTASVPTVIMAILAAEWEDRLLLHYHALSSQGRPMPLHLKAEHVLMIGDTPSQIAVKALDALLQSVAEAEPTCDNGVLQVALRRALKASYHTIHSAFEAAAQAPSSIVSFAAPSKGSKHTIVLLEKINDEAFSSLTKLKAMLQYWGAAGSKLIHSRGLTPEILFASSSEDATVKYPDVAAATVQGAILSLALPVVDVCSNILLTSPLEPTSTTFPACPFGHSFQDWALLLCYMATSHRLHPCPRAILVLVEWFNSMSGEGTAQALLQPASYHTAKALVIAAAAGGAEWAIDPSEPLLSLYKATAFPALANHSCLSLGTQLSLARHGMRAAEFHAKAKTDKQDVTSLLPNEDTQSLAFDEDDIATLGGHVSPATGDSSGDYRGPLVEAGRGERPYNYHRGVAYVPLPPVMLAGAILDAIAAKVGCRSGSSAASVDATVTIAGKLLSIMDGAGPSSKLAEPPRAVFKALLLLPEGFTVQPNANAKAVPISDPYIAFDFAKVLIKLVAIYENAQVNKASAEAGSDILPMRYRKESPWDPSLANEAITSIRHGIFAVLVPYIHDPAARAGPLLWRVVMEALVLSHRSWGVEVFGSNEKEITANCGALMDLLRHTTDKTSTARGSKDLDRRAQEVPESYVCSLLLWEKLCRDVSSINPHFLAVADYFKKSLSFAGLFTHSCQALTPSQIATVTARMPFSVADTAADRTTSLGSLASIFVTTCSQTIGW